MPHDLLIDVRGEPRLIARPKGVCSLAVGDCVRMFDTHAGSLEASARTELPIRVVRDGSVCVRG